MADQVICAVCTEPLVYKVASTMTACDVETACTLVCFHRFHTACVTQWLAHHGTCPTCRHDCGTRCNHTGVEHDTVFAWVRENDAALEREEEEEEEEEKEEEKKDIVMASAAVVAPVAAVAVAAVVVDAALEEKRRRKREANRRYKARLRRQKELGHGHRLRNGTVIPPEVLAQRAARRKEMAKRWRERKRAALNAAAAQ